MKTIFVGELNPYGTDPRFALYPHPSGASGDRLCRLVLGLRRGQYLELFDRANLCRGKWSDEAAAEEACALMDAGVAAGCHRTKFVLLGRKVASAFRRALAGRGITADLKPFEAVVVSGKGALPIDRAFVCLPHPSGACRDWNDPQNFGRAREVLRAAGVL